MFPVVKVILKAVLGLATVVVYFVQFPLAVAMGVKSGSLVAAKDERLNCLQCDCTMGPKLTAVSQPQPSNCHNCFDCGVDG